ncbi:MAG: RnfABCDGE type electron transport complex subunit B [Anaerostipes sp.]|nr:RnfABCDGE type electron transport complex subunit B [Anaerostipes sp.]
MNITAIILAAAVVGGVGLVIAILLGIASEKFKVPVDEKEIAVREELPGNNCGGCGYAGCDSLAKAIAAGEAEVNACPVGGPDAAAKISAIMGVEAGEFIKKVAFVKCAGTCEKASNKYEYSGVQSCIEAMNVPGEGPKACSFGCMGMGSCVAVCPENAISIVSGIAYVDKEACIACGKCVDTCPKNLIELVPFEKKCYVQCNSTDKGKDVMSVCKAGCIGCKLCEKECRLDAIHVENNIAHIDYDKCVGCGLCAKKCPKGIIQTKNA